MFNQKDSTGMFDGVGPPRSEEEGSDTSESKRILRIIKRWIELC